MFRRIAVLVLALGIAATAAACSTQVDAADPPIRLASIASETGSGAAYGVTAQRGVRLAVEEIGNDRIDLRTYDDLSTADGAMAAAKTAVGWNAEAVFAPTLSPLAASVAPMFAQNHIATLGVTNATIDIDAAGAWFWRISKSEADMVTTSVNTATKRGQRAILIWEPADGYSAGSHAAFVAAAAAHGVTIVQEYQYVDGSTTPGRLLSTASAQAPDVVFMALRSAVAADFLSATQGIAPIRIGGNGFNSVAVIDKAGSTADGLIVSGSWNIDEPVPMSARFVESYTARYGTAPDAFAAQGYAAVQVLLAAVRAGGNGTATGMIETGLSRLGRQTNPVPTVLGSFGYTAGREPTYPAVVQQVRSGTLVPFR